MIPFQTELFSPVMLLGLLHRKELCCLALPQPFASIDHSLLQRPFISLPGVLGSDTTPFGSCCPFVFACLALNTLFPEHRPSFPSLPCGIQSGILGLKQLVNEHWHALGELGLLTSVSILVRASVLLCSQLSSCLFQPHQLTSSHKPKSLGCASASDGVLDGRWINSLK